MAKAKEVKSFYGTGRRKGSVAKVTLTPGTGKITVNGKDVNEYMPFDVLVMDLKQPLVLTGNEDSYRKILKKNGFVTRDPRVKERKKYGLKAARRAPQFSKR